MNFRTYVFDATNGFLFSLFFRENEISLRIEGFTNQKNLTSKRDPFLIPTLSYGGDPGSLGCESLRPQSNRFALINGTPAVQLNTDTSPVSIRTETSVSIACRDNCETSGKVTETLLLKKIPVHNIPIENLTSDPR